MEITLGQACCRGVLILRYLSIFLQQTIKLEDLRGKDFRVFSQVADHLVLPFEENIWKI